ncbi:MAG: endonuclease [Bacteroidetes bacterium]|nr:endonuclease [Bacteroidota bacterium]
MTYFSNLRKAQIQLVCIFVSVFYFSDAQAQYYNPAFGKNGTLLKTSLHDIIKGHNVGTYADLWTYFQSSDKKGSNTVWDIYSDIPGGTPPYTYTYTADQCGTYNSEGDCYNREHTWPNTYFGGNIYPMYSDLQHIFPTDGWVNNKRGSLPYGIVNTTTWTSDNGSKTGTSSTYPSSSFDVFEPIDSFKGDLARAFFYMSTRYEGEDAGWTNWEMANGAQLTNEAVNLLLTWHHNDPVSQKELNRNEAVYLIQNNRNPFIDYPIFADCIWGTGDCTSLHVSDKLLASMLTVYPNPCSNTLHIQVPEQIHIHEIQISNLTGQIIWQQNTSSLQIETSALTNGIYVINLHTNQGIVHKLFSKQ